MASNADYTFEQVMNGTGSYNEKGNTGSWSEGVERMQEYLIEIGYTIENTLGFFLEDTTKAVRQFQYECGIQVDGDAGKNTCTRLYAVHASEYFKNYGWPLEESQWGRDNILAGKFGNVDLLARIILAEGGYSNTDDKKGVAIVIGNRAVNSNKKLYLAPADQYPHASVYARVIGKEGQYDTAKANDTAQAPRRGYGGNAANGYIGPAWKTAVDLAKNIVNGITISATGYKVDKTTILSSTMTVNTAQNKEYLNQKAWSYYKSDYNAGDVSADVQPLTFSTSGSSDVIYKIK